MKSSTNKAIINGNYKIMGDGMGFNMTFMESGTFILPDPKNVPVGTTYVIKNWSKDENTIIQVKTINGNNIDLGNHIRTQDYNLKQYECMSVIRYNDDFLWYLY
jgi:hypothetical protein